MGTETQTILSQTIGYSWHYSYETSVGKSECRIIEKRSFGGHTMTKDEAFNELATARALCSDEVVDI
jgi:hypothetical protein